MSMKHETDAYTAAVKKIREERLQLDITPDLDPRHAADPNHAPDGYAIHLKVAEARRQLLREAGREKEIDQ